jgi:hypothetical protein
MMYIFDFGRESKTGQNQSPSILASFSKSTIIWLCDTTCIELYWFYITSWTLPASSALPYPDVSSVLLYSNSNMSPTYFNCAEKSSFVSSSSQLSSHKCIFPLGKSVFSSVQSAEHQLAAHKYIVKYTNLRLGSPRIHHPPPTLRAELARLLRSMLRRLRLCPYCLCPWRTRWRQT